jgi:hypothetical protein
MGRVLTAIWILTLALALLLVREILPIHMGMSMTGAVRTGTTPTRTLGPVVIMSITVMLLIVRWGITETIVVRNPPITGVPMIGNKITFEMNAALNVMGEIETKNADITAQTAMFAIRELPN